MKTYTTNINKLKLVREDSEIKKVKISSSLDSQEFARKFYHDDITIYESFFLILLNNANNTTGYVKISQGGITGTIVDVRILAKYAIEALCTSVILVHNHPSGTLKPSQSDKTITIKVQDALGLFDIKVLDHIILTEHLYFSFADENLL